MQLSTVLAAVTVAVVAGSAVAPVGAPASPAADCAKHPALSPTACCTQLVSPATWTASFTTTAGGGATFNVAVNRSWSPLGADRFYQMVACGYLDSRAEANNDAGFFRVVPSFVVQFGIAGSPAVSAAWQNLVIKDDPVLQSNTAGTFAFATAGPDTRTTQLFVNLVDNSGLDAQGFSPFGQTDAKGLAAIGHIYAGYGQNPDQDQIYAQGDAYLKANFPKLDYITATVNSTAA